MGVDQAGQDVQTGGVDHLLAVRQRVVGADSDDLSVGDGNAALDGGLGRDDRAVLHDQIRFHDSPPRVCLGAVSRSRVALSRCRTSAGSRRRPWSCESASESRMRAFHGCRLSAATKPLRLQARAADHAAGRDPAAQAHQHAVLLVGLVEGVVLGRRRSAGAGRGADDALGAGFGGGVDHDAIGVDVGENDIDARQRFIVCVRRTRSASCASSRAGGSRRPCRRRRRSRAARGRATGTPRRGRSSSW